MLLLSALSLALTGCVAVPSPTPAAVRPPAALAPAADRAPAPLPGEWPMPSQAAPREALDAAGPLPATPPAVPPPVPGRLAAGERPAARPPAHHSLPRSERRPAGRTPKPAKPAPESPQGRAKTRPHRQTAGGPGSRPADMARLCRDAERVRIPYGIPVLCRNTYGP
ncbi:hypothetical protein VO63_04050 [Streptomyces showdoensis]|uniref:Lipoprotein n=2 Tax=Streptomyces showdoensis TaxID=68268 RepID=A0A2P2GVU1_STREW|nr:hypothetical protein VO63_04050 [Streptomyces showdoensis]